MFFHMISLEVITPSVDHEFFNDSTLNSFFDIDIFGTRSSVNKTSVVIQSLLALANGCSTSLEFFLFVI